METKQCIKCEVEYPKTKEYFHFQYNRAGSYLPKSYCKSCARRYVRKWDNENKEHKRKVHAKLMEKYKENGKYKTLFQGNYLHDKVIGVYKILNTITGEFYIGSSKNVRQRVAKHFGVETPSSNPYILKSMAKYGKDAHVWGLMEQCYTQAEARKLERKLIKELNPVWNTVKYNGKK